MKNITCGLVLLASLCATAKADFYYIENEDQIYLSTSIGASVTENLAIRLGIFSDGFVPTSENVDEWSSYWVTASGSNSAGILENGSYWSVSLTLSDTSLIGANEQLYLWVYTSLDSTSLETEWLLLTDTTWQTVASSAIGLDHDFYFTSETTAKLGNFNYNEGTASLAAVATAVPEPATCALIAGVIFMLVSSVARYRRA